MLLCFKTAGCPFMSPWSVGIGPVHFKAYRVTKPWCNYRLIAAFSLLVHICFHVVGFSFFGTMLSNWLERLSLK